MKRSEVLNLIQGLFEIALNPKNDLPAEVHAENLLCHLEEIGMVPLAYKGGEISFDGSDLYTFYTYCDTNWEPENNG